MPRECDVCDGDGRDLDERGQYTNDDCPKCQGEGEVEDSFPQD